MKVQTIKKTAALVHERAIAKGWWEKPELTKKAALVICEVAEAMEAERELKYSKGNEFSNRVVEVMKTRNPDVQPNWGEHRSQVFLRYFLSYVKDSFEDELADVAIRIMDLIGYSGKEYVELPYITNHFSSARSLATEDLIFDLSEILKPENSNYVLALNLVIFFCKEKCIDLESHIDWKIEFNLSRPYKHGKQF